MFITIEELKLFYDASNKGISFDLALLLLAPEESKKSFLQLQEYAVFYMEKRNDEAIIINMNNNAELLNKIFSLMNHIKQTYASTLEVIESCNGNVLFADIKNDAVTGYFDNNYPNPLNKEFHVKKDYRINYSMNIYHGIKVVVNVTNETAYFMAEIESQILQTKQFNISELYEQSRKLKAYRAKGDTTSN